MFSKKKFIMISKINGLIIFFLMLINIMPVTLSKYHSSGVGNMKSNIAFYLLEVGYESEYIKLGDIEPSDKPYVFNFSIGNKKDEEVSEVDIEYDLSIVTTTNLPLRYELYKNSNYLESGAINLITEEITEIKQDEYGTFFKYFNVESGNFYYDEPFINNYTLVVYFDKSNNNFKYQGIVEGLRIVVDSRQMIDT